MTILLVAIAMILVYSVMCGFAIEDGTGTGSSAEVGSDGRLRVKAVTEEDILENNEDAKKVWTMPFGGSNATTAAVTDYFLYIKNTANSSEIQVLDISVFTDTATTLEIRAVTGTAAGETDITPINRNRGSVNLPTGDLSMGVNITGLTPLGETANNNVLYYMRLATANTQYHLDMVGRIILSPNTAIAISSSVAAALTGQITIAEHIAE